MMTSGTIAIAESNFARATSEKFARNKNLLWVYPPYWAEEDEDEMKYFEDYEFLLEHGQVVWGVVVQANKFMWKPSDIMAGATVIYSHGARDDFALKRLMETSSRLFDLKASAIPSDPQECAYRAMLIDEMDCGHGLPVPRTLSDGLDAISTTVLFPRSHMEGKMLALKHFPLLVHPDKVAAVMVPSIFWGDEFKAEWRARIQLSKSDEKGRLFAPRGIWSKFKIGMGSALHQRNIFYALLSPIIWIFTIHYFFYQIDHSPVVAKSLEELKAIPSDEFVEFTAPLQLNQKLRNLTWKKDSWLIPLAGSGHSAFTTRKESKHDDSKYIDGEPRSKPEPIRGRLYRERPDSDWRVGFHLYHVRGEYKRHNIKVPSGFIVIDESKQPSILKALLTGGFLLLMTVIPLSAIRRIYRTYRMFVRDDRELLSKLWQQRKALADKSPEDYDT